MVTKLKKNSNCDKAQKLKLLQNSNCDKTQIVSKLKNLKCDKTQIVTKLELRNMSMYEENLVRTF